MVKRRSPYGVQMSMGSLVAPLAANALVEPLLNTLDLDETWRHWWEKSSAEQFYVDDLFILKSPEFHRAKKN